MEIIPCNIFITKFVQLQSFFKNYFCKCKTPLDGVLRHSAVLQIYVHTTITLQFYETTVLFTKTLLNRKSEMEM